METKKVVIVGSGAAGYTAGIYSARADLGPLLFSGVGMGGQLMITSDVENFPGFSEPVPGPDLMERMRKQCERLGVKIVQEDVARVDLSRRPFQPADNSWAEARLLDSERQCADYTVRFFVVSLARGVQKIFIHAGSNGKANENDVDCPLLVHGAPRKLLPALAVLTQLLGPAPVCAGERNLSGPDCCVAFETPERSVLVFWQSSGDGSKPNLPTGSDLTWLDTMGRKLAGPPAKLSSSPVYLVAPAGKAKELLR